MKRLKINFPLAFTAMALLVSGCHEGVTVNPYNPGPGPKEPEGVRIYFTFPDEQSMPSHAVMKSVERLDLFVFDREGYFQGLWSDRALDMAPDTYMTLPLEEGIYRFVAWGNMTRCFVTKPVAFVPGSTLFEHVQVQTLRGDNDVIDSPIPSLFHGWIKEVEVRDRPNEHYFMPMACNAYKINVSTLNMRNTGDAYRLVVSDNNGNYYFDNSFAECNTLHYTTDCTKDTDGQIHGSLLLNRLDENRRNPVLQIFKGSSQVPIYRCNLVETILLLRERGYAVDFTTMHEFDIVLYFNDDMTVEVSVNGWKILESDNIVN